MNCNCVSGDIKPGTDDDNLKPGFDYIDKILLFKWDYKIYNPYGFQVAQGNIVDDNGKYYMAAIWNYFGPEFYKDTIEETGLVAHTASELGAGKWLIPVDTKEENWVLYKSINNQMQWMQLKNGVWEAVWGGLNMEIYVMTMVRYMCIRVPRERRHLGEETGFE